MVKLLLLFTIVPLGELALLLWIDDLVGLLPTVAVVLVTGALGAVLARSEGLRVLRQWQRSVVRGKVPEEGVLGGVLVLIGGVLLVTPGVITDLTGFLLLIPQTRRAIAAVIRRRLEERLQDGTIQVVNFSTVTDQEPIFRQERDFTPSNVVMDVEAEDVDDDEDTSEPRRVLH